MFPRLAFIFAMIFLIVFVLLVLIPLILATIVPIFKAAAAIPIPGLDRRRLEADHRCQK
jgi:hypothetical protein